MDILLYNENTKGVFNVSSGNSYSIKQIYDLLCDYLGKSNKNVTINPIASDDVLEVCLDPQKVFEKFKWKADVNFEEMIEKQLKWYDKHGVGKLYSHLKAS